MDRIEDIYRELTGRAWRSYQFPLAEDLNVVSPHHAVQIRPVMGHTLLASKVHALVSAMASFTPPAVGQVAHAGAFKPWNTPMLTVDGGT